MEATIVFREAGLLDFAGPGFNCRRFRPPYNRAADLAKSYVEHWDREPRASAANTPTTIGMQKPKPGNWRIIEKEIRGLAADPKSERGS
jgi:hypothetical protein